MLCSLCICCGSLLLGVFYVLLLLLYGFIFWVIISYFYVRLFLLTVYSLYEEVVFCLYIFTFVVSSIIICTICVVFNFYCLFRNIIIVTHIFCLLIFIGLGVSSLALQFFPTLSVLFGRFTLFVILDLDMVGSCILIFEVRCISLIFVVILLSFDFFLSTNSDFFSLLPTVNDFPG